MGRHEILIVRRIHGIAQILLLLVGHAAGGVGLHLRLGEGRQEHSCQDCNNGNDHQQFDECEPCARGIGFHSDRNPIHHPRKARQKRFEELPCGRRSHPQPKVLQRSGMGPKPALEAIILTHRAQREC